jgi:hypothetical protein
MRRALVQASVYFGLLFSAGYSDPAVLVESENDTVVKFIYIGSSPSSTAHPVISVEGKALGIKSKALNSSGARGVVGQVTGTNPTSTTSTVGLAGAGYYGVHGTGSGSGVGVYGSAGYGTAVKGVATNIGVEGEADYYGVYGLSNNGYAGYFEGSVYGDVFYTGSDAMLKQNVRPLEKGLATVMSLTPKAYEMKNGVTRAKRDPRTKFGLIAQDVQLVLPEVVADIKSPERNADGDLAKGKQVEFKALDYMALVPILIKAIQEQQAQIERMQVEISGLKN